MFCKIFMGLQFAYTSVHTAAELLMKAWLVCVLESVACSEKVVLALDHTTAVQAVCCAV